MSALGKWWDAIVRGQRHDIWAWLGRQFFSSLAGLYALGLEANLGIYRWGLRRPIQAVLPVISVGNLTLGGSGKSTAVRFLARQLQGRGLRPGIVLRGHKRRSRAPVLLASDGKALQAPMAEVGDEATELALTLSDTPIAVGKRREQAIGLLEGAGADIALLDDGFQYFGLARVLDIVLVSARLDFAQARLFPRGYLREPWAHLRRADQIWITHADEVPARQVEALAAWLEQWAPGRLCAWACHTPQGLMTLAGKPVALEKLQGMAVLAVSGLGCPESFERALEKLGATVTPLRFPDHHFYSEGDLARIVQQAEACNADAIVTTAKDAVKFPRDWPSPVWVLRVEMKLIRGEATVAEALDRIVATVAEARAEERHIAAEAPAAGVEEA